MRPIPEPVVCADVAWIPLTQGKRTVIDAADVSIARGRRWHYSDGYAVAKIDGRRVRLHTLLTGRTSVDHCNRNSLDNRRKNLRPATQAQNLANNASRIGKSGFKGVQARGKRWGAWISIDNRSTYLGTYDTAQDAARAYDLRAVELFGEFAVTNESLGLL